MKKIFALLALAATLLPMAFTINEAGGLNSWQGITPKGTTDSLYYYARMHEVADGHILIGNPYVYEYREVLSPAFFLPDVISAVPILIGIPFNIAIALNVFIWSFVFLLLGYKLFETLRLPRNWSLGSTVILYLVSYSFVLRPTVMQLIYPLFLGFLISFLRFVEEPNSRKKMIWLAVTSALTFYTYTYLSYIVILSFAVCLVYYLWCRKFQDARQLIIAGLLNVVMIVPFGIYTLFQMNGPYYMETFKRIGLVYTHLPANEAYLYGRWLILSLLALWIVWKLINKKEYFETPKKFMSFVGVALFLGLFLNVFTGVELTLAVHIGRFVTLWLVIVLFYGLYSLYAGDIRREQKYKLAIAAFVFFVLLAGVGKNVIRGFDFFKFNKRAVLPLKEIQSYGPPLKWLNNVSDQELVVFANDSISQYIPIATKHYPLFFQGAILHNIPTSEVEERYLLSRSFTNISTESIKSEFGLYTGAGLYKEAPRVFNERVRWCEWYSKISKYNCPSKVTAVSLQGEEYFQALFKRSIDIKKDQAFLLNKYNVSYLVLDTKRDDLKIITKHKPVYDDGRYKIYSLPL